jgi:hypothetical protein
MMRPVPLLFALGCLGFTATAAAQTQGLPDPTRPPPGWLPRDPKAAVVAESKDTDAPVQLVLTGKTRRFAIVRGEVISESGKGSRLVEIQRDNLIVQSDKGRETLSLFPDVHKTPPKKTYGMGHKDQK